VARYHVVQRVFHEGLVLNSAAGVGVHVALLVGAVVAAGGVAVAARWIASGRLGVGAVGVTFAAVLALTAVFAAPGLNTAKPQVTRSSSRSDAANIVLIIADTLRADAFEDRTRADPARSGMARLAADGVRYSRAYAQSSWTRPSIATILTSLHPAEHTATHKMAPLPDEVTTLAEVLQGHGYWTAGIVTNINVAPIFGYDQGFGEYQYLEPDFYFGATDSATRLAIYKGLRLARERLFGSYVYYANYYQDAAVVDRAVDEWLAQDPPQPFLLLVHYMDPHDPYFEIPYNGHGIARVSTPSPAPAEAEELRRLYDTGVNYFDDYLARLLSRLDQKGLYDNTAIAFVADHGEEFYEHGGWWHGTTLYEEQIRVPLVVKRPQDSAGGTVESTRVRTLDIAPTLLVAAGVPVPREFSGADLFSPGRASQGEPMFAEEDLEGNVLAALIQDDWKIITANSGNPRGLAPLELYDLARDPQERENLASERPEEVARLLQLMQRHRRRIGD
jgi:arylsulfatase A-like enzyme